MVVFPHANGHTVADDDFRVAWRELCSRFPVDPVTLELPRLSRRVPIVEMEVSGQQRSLEYLCKLLVPNGYKGTAQATNTFLTRNSHVVRATLHPVRNPATTRDVKGVKLVGQIPAIVLATHIEARFEADGDLDDNEDYNAVVGLQALDGPPTQGDVVSHALAAIPAPPASIASSVPTSPYILEFIRDVHTEQYYPSYRGKHIPPGSPIVGWDDRLAAYFWPKPTDGLATNNAILKPLLTRAAKLAAQVATRAAWTPAEDADAQSLALAIFDWGGVPQKSSIMTPANIRSVFDAAILGPPAPGTPMNSGWTKVAAFSTDHLPTADQHVIWDSRVSTSVVRRLDAIFQRHRLTVVPSLFRGIGLVNVGRGGSRPIRAGQLGLRWINGYKSWSAQIAGSQFVREVCAGLNAGVVHTSRCGRWTIREVEMVLFMDGY